MENSLSIYIGFPGNSDGKKSACNVGDLGLIPGLGRFPWKSEWLPTPVFLPGDFHGQRNLAGYSHGVTKSQTQLSDFHKVLYIYIYIYTYMAESLCYTAEINTTLYIKYISLKFLWKMLCDLICQQCPLPYQRLYFILFSFLVCSLKTYHIIYWCRQRRENGWRKLCN